jgi:hypothetical protein
LGIEQRISSCGLAIPGIVEQRLQQRPGSLISVIYGAYYIPRGIIT